jgi:hypothetical protein
VASGTLSKAVLMTAVALSEETSRRRTLSGVIDSRFCDVGITAAAELPTASSCRSVLQWMIFEPGESKRRLELYQGLASLLSDIES